MELGLFIQSISNSVNEINMDIEKLSSNPINHKQQVLAHLDTEVKKLERKIKNFSESNHLTIQEIPTPYSRVYTQQVRVAVNTTRSFTSDELALYNGKNGNPAYVAVNGVVYDVTNNPAWAAATHFGLNAGNDVTNEFASCHAGENILSKLPVVGKLS